MPWFGIAYYGGMYRLTQVGNGLATGFSATKEDLVKAADKLAKSGFDFTKSSSAKIHLKNWKKTPPEVKLLVAAALHGLGVQIL